MIPGRDGVEAGARVKPPDGGAAVVGQEAVRAIMKQPGKPQMVGQGHFLRVEPVAALKIRRVAIERLPDVLGHVFDARPLLVG